MATFSINRLAMEEFFEQKLRTSSQGAGIWEKGPLRVPIYQSKTLLITQVEYFINLA
jgi:hypothetical protein